jgi:hypothetical protein
LVAEDLLHRYRLDHRPDRGEGLRGQQAHDEMLMGALDPGEELRQRELEDLRLSEKMVTTNVIKVYVE